MRRLLRIRQDSCTILPAINLPGLTCSPCGQPVDNSNPTFWKSYSTLKGVEVRGGLVIGEQRPSDSAATLAVHNLFGMWDLRLLGKKVAKTMPVSLVRGPKLAQTPKILGIFPEQGAPSWIISRKTPAQPGKKYGFGHSFLPRSAGTKPGSVSVPGRRAH